MLRDDLIVNDQYSLDAHHSEEKGVKLRKKIYFVTVLLSVITFVEVMMGVFVKQNYDLWPVVKWGFIVLTLIKAGYIVLSFMHLGDERKNAKYVILIPYFIFAVYLLLLTLNEGGYTAPIM